MLGTLDFTGQNTGLPSGVGKKDIMNYLPTKLVWSVLFLHFY